MRWVRARWDFARYVITAEFADTGVWSWVLDPAGVVLGQRSEAVACPRAGCVTVSAASEQSSEEGDTSAMVLRVQFIAGGAEGFATTTAAREVRGLL